MVRVRIERDISYDHLIMLVSLERGKNKPLFFRRCFFDKECD